MTSWWEEQPDSSDEAVIARWLELQPLSRVLYAKARAGKERYKRALSEDITLTHIGTGVELEAEVHTDTPGATAVPSSDWVAP